MCLAHRLATCFTPVAVGSRWRHLHLSHQRPYRRCIARALEGSTRKLQAVFRLTARYCSIGNFGTPGLRKSRSGARCSRASAAPISAGEVAPRAARSRCGPVGGLVQRRAVAQMLGLAHRGHRATPCLTKKSSVVHPQPPQRAMRAGYVQVRSIQTGTQRQYVKGVDPSAGRTSVVRQGRRPPTLPSTVYPCRAAISRN